MKRYIELAGGALEAIEFVVFAFAATALVALGPLIWFYRLITAHRVAWAAAVAILWLASVVVVAREVRRGAITPFSLGVFQTWLVALVYVFHDWITDWIT